MYVLIYCGQFSICKCIILYRCESTPSLGICASTFVSQYTHYIPLRSRNTTSYQELLEEIVGSGNFSENCTDILVSLGCYITYPPCDSETGNAIPLCTENCIEKFGLIQSCFVESEIDLTQNSNYGALEKTMDFFDCKDVSSYLPEFLHIASDQCINSTDFGEFYSI